MAETIPEIIDLIADITQQRDIEEATMLQYLNNFYQNQFFLDIGKYSTRKIWNFQTLVNVDEYDVPERYRLIPKNEVMLSGETINLYFDKMEFDQYFPDSYVGTESLGTGDGIVNNFTGTLTSIPVVYKSLIISDGVETFKDDGLGVLTGSLGGHGTIAYLTGVYDVTFYSSPADGTDISSNYAQYAASWPEAVLYYNNILKFRPIPDKTYDVNIEVSERPIALTTTSSLENSFWGDAIAYGTAIDILNRYGNEAEALYARRVYSQKLSVILSYAYKITSTTKKSKPRW